MLRGFVREHEHHLLFGSGLRADDDVITEPIGEHLFILAALAKQFLKRVCFKTARATFGSQAL
jgi:hypothetical protein